jgi:hypothetical protein
MVPSRPLDPGGRAPPGVVTISTTDAWAVGYAGHPFATLTVHWDGASWTVVPSPNGTTHRNVLSAVSATGPADVWAVGYQLVDGDVGGVALIEHWDGHAWSIVPAHAGGSSVLYGVKANAADDVWAVGSRGSYPPEVTLTEHWDGASWTVVPSPSPGVADRLHAVDGTSGSDVWAVGSTFRSAPTAHGLILRGDGSAWTRERGGAGPDGVYTFLLATTAITAGDAWAMGETGAAGTTCRARRPPRRRGSSGWTRSAPVTCGRSGAGTPPTAACRSFTGTAHAG